MKIDKVEVLRCDGGWREFLYLKIGTKDGTTGWSEFQESWGSLGLAGIVEALGATIIGKDARQIELIISTLKANTTQSRGGLNSQAIGAIENALLDIKGKALGVPVYDLLGGAVRTRIPIYWSHCGAWRALFLEHLDGAAPLKNYDDVAKLGEEVKKKGFKALKTNTLLYDNGKLMLYGPARGHGGSNFPALNWTDEILKAATDTVGAMRAGGGPEMGIMLDINLHMRTEGFRKLAQALTPFNMTWLEIDSHDAKALKLIRDDTKIPIASCEILYDRAEFKPFFEQRAMDVCIIDVIFNGYAELMKIAAMAEAYDINVAPHNFYSHFATAISAHFSAAVPNLRTMEIDIDGSRYRDEYVSSPPVIENGELIVPSGPGWGIEINEKAVRARPFKR